MPARVASQEKLALVVAIEHGYDAIAELLKPHLVYGLTAEVVRRAVRKAM